ncbi:MAG TPA: energy transducer TonB [Allosphingosinicella sp.]|nr:energy transducer TonB [Allosphingosinicella sp.]
MRKLLASLLAGALLAAPAFAFEPEPGPDWVVSRAEQYCSLTRQSGPASFALRTVPGSGVWEVRLASRNWSNVTLRDARRLAIRLQPEGGPLGGSQYARHTEAGRSLDVYQIPRSDLGRFAAAQGITVARNRETILDIPLNGAAQAIAAVRQCEDETLREWGIDPVAFAALRTPATGLPAAVVTDDDYPAAAMRAHQSGMVVVRLMIGANGRVSDCTPVVSSGHAILDTRTCQIFRERLRMTPAIGADGTPTAAPMVTPLGWRLPG